MKKLLLSILFCPVFLWGQQAVTVLNNGSGTGTFNTPGVTYYLAGPPGGTWDFTNVTVKGVSGGGGGGTTPAAPTNSIQFNNNGAFGGSQGLEWLGGFQLTVGTNGTANTGPTIEALGGTGTGTSEGILVSAGTNASDYALQLDQRPMNTRMFTVTGAGQLQMPLYYNTPGTLVTDASGNITVAGAGTFPQEAATIAAMKALTVSGLTTGAQCIVGSYYAISNYAGQAMGGDLYVYNSASSTADNGGSVIAPNAGSGRWILATLAVPNNTGFGSYENGAFANSGNQENLASGTDDTTAIGKWIASAKATNATGSHYGGSDLYWPFGISLMNGSFTVANHYTYINGDGYGASMIVPAVSGGNQATNCVTWLRGLTGNAFNDLTSGGGLSNISLHTNATNPRYNGLCLDYCEYMNFDNVRLDNFAQSAILAGLWEGSFKNTKIYLCGVLQTSSGVTPTTGTTPDTGCIDFDSKDSSNVFEQAANNTFFSRTTFSGCYGTYVKFSAFQGNIGANTTGVFFDGVYSENSTSDGGGVQELPVLYVNHADLCGMTNGEMTFNSTGTTHYAPFLRMDEIGGNHFNLTSFTIEMNPTSGVGTRVTQVLGSVAYLNGANTHLTMQDVKIQDEADSIGYSDAGGRQPLFIGTGIVNCYGLVIYTYAPTPLSTSGLQRGTNIFARTLTVNGDMTFVPYTTGGAYGAYTTHYRFSNGAVTLLANALPTTNDQWVAGDRVEYDANGVSANGYLGQVCIQAGNTGSLSAITGSVAGAPTKTVTVSSATNLLPGDIIHLTGGIAANAIVSISGNTLTMQSNETSNLSTVAVQFVAPLWQGYGAPGTVTNTGGSLTSNSVVLGAGTNNSTVVAGIKTDGTSQLQLGVAGSTVGSVQFSNATSGTDTISPPTGALGTIALVWPATSGTLALSSNAADVSTVASGTAYTMTNGFVNVTFGTTSPTVTLTAAGTYLLQYTAQTSLAGSTYASVQAANYLMNRQNNTPATIAGTSFSGVLPIVTTTTGPGPSVACASVLYTTANTNDVIGLQADVSATPSAGSVTCSAATITAVWLHP